MSHHISAVTSPFDERGYGHLVASFDLNASARDRSRIFYLTLDASEYDGGCSGTGKGREFTQSEILSALSLYREAQTMSDLDHQMECMLHAHEEVEFLTACSEFEFVNIYFS